MEFYRCEYHEHERTVKLHFDVYVMLRETPRGYWVIPQRLFNYPDDWKEKEKRWISKDSRKRYCYPTKEEAYASFKRRKEIYLSILRRRIEVLDVAVNLTMENAEIRKPVDLCFEYY